jgi:hypothetical protein
MSNVNVPQSEYRYSEEARQRALLLLAIIGFVLTGLVIYLFTSWPFLSLPTKALGILLLVGMLFTLRAQLTRLVFRFRLYPNQFELKMLFGNRTMPWEQIVEVRRLKVPQLGGKPRWACTVYTLSRTGTSLPTYLFDDQLQNAEQALQDVVQHTPHARKTNV